MNKNKEFIELINDSVNYLNLTHPSNFDSQILLNRLRALEGMVGFIQYNEHDYGRQIRQLARQLQNDIVNLEFYINKDKEVKQDRHDQLRRVGQDLTELLKAFEQEKLAKEEKIITNKEESVVSKGKPVIKEEKANPNFVDRILSLFTGKKKETKEEETIIVSNEEERLFDRAVSINTIKGYQNFIKNYPESHFNKEAKENIKKLEEENLWEKIKRKNNAIDYRKYIRIYPNGLFLEQAIKSEVESLLKEFAHRTPIHIVEFEKRIEQLKEEKNTAALNAQYERAFDLKEMEDKMILQFIQEQDEWISFLKSKSDFEIEENQVWKKTTDNNTRIAYQTYLDKYSNGIFRKEAKKRIKKILEIEEIKKTKKRIATDKAIDIKEDTINFTAFEGQSIRKIEHNEEWWFAVEDVIEVMTDSKNPRSYTNALFRKEPELKAITLFFRVDRKDDEKRQQYLRFANTEGIFRLIMSIPSRKAEPFKLWLASLGKQALEEEENRLYTIFIKTTDKNYSKYSVEHLDNWHTKYGNGHFRLAAFAAFPLYITADLLYTIWQNFKNTEGVEIPRVAVSDLLLSGLLHEVSTELFEYAPDLRRNLLQALQEYHGERDILKELGAFMLDYLATHYAEGVAYTEPIREAEEWNALAYYAPAQANAKLAAALNPSAAKNYQTRQLRAVFLAEKLQDQSAIRKLDPSVQEGFERVLIISKGIKPYIQGDFGEAYAQFQQLPDFRMRSENEGNSEGVASLTLPKGVVQQLETNSSIEAALKRIQEVKEKKLTILDLSNLGLEELPNEISELIWLENLKCDKNTFSDISVLKNLIQLQIIDISVTNVNDLNPIKDLKNLQVLNAGFTKLIDLSPVQELINLKHLYVSNTEISDLSPLKGLINLELIDLWKTTIIDLSPLKGLINLKRLDISHTKVVYLSPLKDLINLVTLDINNTEVYDLMPIKMLIEKDISVKLEKVKSLNQIGIFVETCALINPPIEIVEQGNEAILRYFDELERTGSVKVNEANLIVLGEPRAGKTSLIYRLIQANDGNENLILHGEGNVGKTRSIGRELPDPNDSTHGIETFEYEFTQANGEHFRIHIKDFGGQQIYYGLQQFFFTKESLYVLVANSDFSGHDFDFWLQSVELLSGGSSVIIVINEPTERMISTNLNELEEKFKNIKGIYSTNIYTGRGVKEVKEAIEFHVQELPQIGKLYLKSFALIRQRLESLSLSRDYITTFEYFKICSEHGVNDRELALDYSRTMQTLGIFLHFQNDIILENLFIIRISWVTDAMYILLNNENIKRQFGRFNTEDLNFIWHHAQLNNKKTELLALMRHFELCYELSNIEGVKEWIVPQLLPTEQANFNWKYENNLVLRYNYEFMPKGLISRFIARNNSYILDKHLVWRTGVLMRNNQTMAWVNQILDKKEIIIRVVGDNAKEFMTLIVEDFDTMHNYYKRLQVDKMIGCNCDDCKTTLTPYFYLFDTLKRYEEKGKEVVECNKSFKDVNIMGLLNGIFSEVSKDEEHIGVFDLEPEMVSVEGGIFKMGSYDSDMNTEKPVHEVILDNFLIGQYLVTQAQWKAVMGNNPSGFQGNDNCPVEMVSWDDIQDFIEKLNKITNKNYRLPTEAEWEYAAKGGIRSKGFTYSGGVDVYEVAWFAGNSEIKTHPVGMKKWNELGIYDMSGNVWEWCSDFYGIYPDSTRVNPQGADSGTNRVQRGGGWGNNAINCRPTFRKSYPPNDRNDFTGFRLALTIESS